MYLVLKYKVPATCSAQGLLVVIQSLCGRRTKAGLDANTSISLLSLFIMCLGIQGSLLSVRANTALKSSTGGCVLVVAEYWALGSISSTKNIWLGIGSELTFINISFSVSGSLWGPKQLNCFKPPKHPWGEKEMLGSWLNLHRAPCRCERPVSRPQERGLVPHLWGSWFRSQYLRWKKKDRGDSDRVKSYDGWVNWGCTGEEILND